MRPKILITNADRNGKVYEDPPRWFVRVGKASKTFTQEIWEQDGIAWINERIAGE